MIRPPDQPLREQTPSSGVALRVLGGALALAAGIAALVVAILLLHTVLA